MTENVSAKYIDEDAAVVMQVNEDLTTLKTTENSPFKGYLISDMLQKCALSSLQAPQPSCSTTVRCTVLTFPISSYCYYFAPLDMTDSKNVPIALIVRF
jgi:hypothetical protein